ncbi:Guanine nucleotide-binding protein alpha-1 subunit [Citrus sinensis]|nr:Guanine nucleotide-binding protein alpha-1 subunit [Citrus sinensis]
MGDQSDGDKRAGVEDKNLLQYDCLHSNMSHGQTKKSEVKNRRYNAADSEENAQVLESLGSQQFLSRQDLLMIVPLASGFILYTKNADIFIFLAYNSMQIKLLFQTGFDEAELKSYISVIHANVYQTIKVLYDGSKELAQNETDSMKFVVSSENKEIGEKLSEIGGRLDYPRLTKELAEDIETLWADPAIQETYAHGNELQLPDCANYFMENLQRLSDANYVPTKDDVLYARVRTTGVVEIQFRYDQTLFEDEQKNRMMETKELFDWVLKQPCFEVPLNVCEWFKDYQPVSTGKQEIENAYEFVKKKFEELYFQSTAPDRVDRVFKIYRTTALDPKLVKKTFKLVDETLRRRHLFEAGLL